MKNKKQEQSFYSIENLLKVGADYNVIYGERSNGKSYAVKKHALCLFRDKGEKFVYMRRYDRDITTNLATSYFGDAPLYEIFNGEFNVIYAYGGNVYLAHVDENGKKSNVTHCGYVRAVNSAQRYASTTYPNVSTIILEEFITINGDYLPNELFLFNHVLSTIARRRNVTVFLIANSVSRISPYWREYDLDNIIKPQYQGTIHAIARETDGGEQKIAVEYCSPSGGESKMFDAKNSKMTNKGKWLTKSFPKPPVDVLTCSNPYSFVIKYTSFAFLVQYMIHELGGFFLYVTPKTTDIKPNTRVISDEYSINPLHTRGLIPLNQKERQIFDMIQNGKIYYCEDLTGTEFETVIKQLRQINF